MTGKHIAFLRALNVGGRNVAMADLRRHFEALGCVSVETHIASGNVFFESGQADGSGLEQMLETGLEQRLKFPVVVFVRKCPDLCELRDWPFAAKLATASNIIFLKESLSREQVAQLNDLESDVDSFEVRGSHIAWRCAVKQSESRFSNAVLERKLGLRSTIRTRKTIVDIVKRFCQGSNELPHSG